MIDLNYYKNAAIDFSHIDLIKGLVKANKPHSILELGFGTGYSTAGILDAIQYNEQDCIYTLVDNWLDYDGKQPYPTLLDVRYKCLEWNIITSSEEDFINKAFDNYEYDFILSDADHTNSHKWFDKTLGLLKDGGIACFHDVTTNDFPNLAQNIDWLEQGRDTQPYHWKVFNTNSRQDERCDRGLLVVFKD